MKKIFAAALASVMLLSGLTIFAGCGEEYKSELNLGVDLSKPIDLRGCYPETGMAAFGKDDTAKIIERITGYKVKYEELGSNADNDVNKYLSTQEKFHFMKLTEAQYHPYLKGGTFCDLTELLENTEPGRILYQLIDLMDYGWDSVTYVDEDGTKHIYGIPDFGYVSMTDSAMIWNRVHLQKIGFEERYPDTENGMPETMEQLEWALHECQKTFGAKNDAYHAFGLPGSNAVEVVQLKGAFEVPFQFYVDDQGKIQQYVFSENTTKYTEYMHHLFEDSILAPAWQSENAAGLNQKFGQELYSCVALPYWQVTPLINAAVSQGKIAESMGHDPKAADFKDYNNYDYLRANAFGWQLRVKGDGTGGSVVQEKARVEGGAAGVSYYTVIPAYMQDTALYTIDFLAKKMIYFAEFYGGNGLDKEAQAQYGNDPAKFPQDTHWYEIDTPESKIPGEKTPEPEDYQGYLKKYIDEGYSPNLAAEMVEQNVYNKFEDLDEMVIFLRPYEYSYTRYSNKDPNGGNMLVKYVCKCGYVYNAEMGVPATDTQEAVEAGTSWRNVPDTFVCPRCGASKAAFTKDESQIESEEVTVSQKGMWIKLTDRYVKQINDNSQYCNGTNAVSARVLFHLRETGFNAWRVVTPMDDTLIENPMAMCPPFEHWAPVSILARTYLKDGIKTAIQAKDPRASLDSTRKGVLKKSTTNKGERFYYWSDEIVNEMTAWYNDVKLQRQ